MLIRVEDAKAAKVWVVLEKTEQRVFSLWETERGAAAEAYELNHDLERPTEVFEIQEWIVQE